MKQWIITIIRCRLYVERAIRRVDSLIDREAVGSFWNGAFGIESYKGVLGLIEDRDKLVTIKSLFRHMTKDASSIERDIVCILAGIYTRQEIAHKYDSTRGGMMVRIARYMGHLENVLRELGYDNYRLDSEFGNVGIVSNVRQDMAKKDRHGERCVGSSPKVA